MLQFVQSIRYSSASCVVALIDVLALGNDADVQGPQPQVVYTESRGPYAQSIQSALRSSLDGLHHLRCMVSFDLKRESMVRKGIGNLYGLIGDNDRSPLALSHSVFFNFIHENDRALLRLQPPATNNGPIFLVFYSGSGYSADSADITWLYYFCWFCVEPKLKPIYLSTSLTHWHLIQSAELATDEGKNITWELDEWERWSQESFCAHYNQRCEVEQLGAVLEEHVMTPFKERKPGKSPYRDRDGTGFVRFSKRNCLTEYIPLPEIPEDSIYFITADGVEETSPPVGGYLLPFQSDVWLSIYLCLFVLSAGLTLATLKGKQHFPERYLGTLIWLLRVLIGQRDSSPLPESTSKDFPHSKGIVILSWLLTTFVLRSVYLQIMPTKYIKPSGRSNWTDLELMENFTFYIPWSGYKTPDLLKNYALSGYPSEKELMCAVGQVYEEITLCPIFERLYLARTSGNRHMTVRAFTRYEAHSVIVDELMMRPKTAIVTTGEGVQRIWRQCVELMTLPGVMFALGRSSGYHSAPNYVCTSTNLDRSLYNRIIRSRLMKAFSSGIVSLWEDVARATTEQRRRRGMNTNGDWNGPRAWAMSDALFIFGICGMLANLACVVYFIELLININKPDKRGPKPRVIAPVRISNPNVDSVAKADISQ